MVAELVGRLRARGSTVVMLDGDELREVFGAVAVNAKNYGREGRLVLAMQDALSMPGDRCSGVYCGDRDNFSVQGSSQLEPAKRLGIETHGYAARVESL